ncbi:insulinase family protein, partial [Vibrio parahaemolyticus]
LNHNLREDKGYTYGAGSGFQMDRVTGSFVAGASVRADVTGASLKEFFKEFAAIRGGDITDAEMAKAAASLRTYGIQKFEGLGGLVSAGA